jgi:rfaE bifunctional protein kinase chain/domain
MDERRAHLHRATERGAYSLMTASELLRRMNEMRVLVVGDVCLDRWCIYEPSLSEASRETGLPRTAVTRTETTPGAAGTVANNLRSLGVGDVAVLGLAADDGYGCELLKAMKSRGIRTDLLVKNSELPTFTYTKLINSETGVEDKSRVDFVFTQDIPVDVEDAVCEQLRKYGRDFDLICVSDQAETERGGIVTAATRDTLAELAGAGKLIWVDSRRRIEHFRSAVLKVNHQEASEARARCGDVPLSDILKTTEAPAMFVTHGGNGVQILNQAGETWLMTKRVVAPVDICGAGDSFTAGAACALAAGANHHAAARLGPLIASITIMKEGTGVAYPGELLEAEKAGE